MFMLLYEITVSVCDYPNSARYFYIATKRTINTRKKIREKWARPNVMQYNDVKLILIHLWRPYWCWWILSFERSITYLYHGEDVLCEFLKLNSEERKIFNSHCSCLWISQSCFLVYAHRKNVEMILYLWSDFAFWLKWGF